MEKPKYIYYEVHGQTVDENIDPVQEINVVCTDRGVAHDIVEILFMKGYDSFSIDVIGTMERLVL